MDYALGDGSGDGLLGQPHPEILQLTDGSKVTVYRRVEDHYRRLWVNTPQGWYTADEYFGPLIPPPASVLPYATGNNFGAPTHQTPAPQGPYMPMLAAQPGHSAQNAQPMPKPVNTPVPTPDANKPKPRPVPKKGQQRAATGVKGGADSDDELPPTISAPKGKGKATSGAKANNSKPAKPTASTGSTKSGASKVKTVAAPKKGGRQVGATAYCIGESTNLFTSADIVRPVGPDDWPKVTDLYNQLADRDGYRHRDTRPLRQAWDKLYKRAVSDKPPTGDPGYPRLFRKIQALHTDIFTGVGGRNVTDGYESSSGGEDDDVLFEDLDPEVGDDSDIEFLDEPPKVKAEPRVKAEPKVKAEPNKGPKKAPAPAKPAGFDSGVKREREKQKVQNVDLKAAVAVMADPNVREQRDQKKAELNFFVAELSAKNEEIRRLRDKLDETKDTLANTTQQMQMQTLQLQALQSARDANYSPSRSNRHHPRSPRSPRTPRHHRYASRYAPYSTGTRAHHARRSPGGPYSAPSRRVRSPSPSSPTRDHDDPWGDDDKWGFVSDEPASLTRTWDEDVQMVGVGSSSSVAGPSQPKGRSSALGSVFSSAPASSTQGSKFAPPSFTLPPLRVPSSPPAASIPPIQQHLSPLMNVLPAHLRRAAGGPGEAKFPST